MRILHLANHCDEIGNGIINVAVDLACAQAAAGHEVSFASQHGTYVPLLAEHGVSHVDLPHHWRAVRTLPAAWRGLRALVGDLRPDVVHAHMMTGAVLARLVRGRAPWALVTTIHNEWQRSANVMAVGDRVIAVSEAVAGRMAKRGLSAARMDVVRNGPLGSPRRRGEPARSSIGLGRPAILTVAGLYERKGIGDLIAAFELVAAHQREATLTIVGDGPDRARFEAQARESPYADRISFTGFVADPRPYFRAADIFVLASRNEPFGLVIAEAREAGCAIVGTDVGGIPEVLEGGRAGLLVPPHHPDALADVLLALAADPRTLLRWRDAAASGLDWLHVDRTAAETVGIYRRAVADREARLRPAGRGEHPSPVPREPATAGDGGAPPGRHV